MVPDYEIKNYIGLNPQKIEEKNLSGKVCIVTGGARGIGKRVATYFANCGATVIIADCLEDKGRILAFKLNTRRKASSGFARYMYIDLGDGESIKTFVKRFAYDYDRLDILINNAGIGTTGGVNRDFGERRASSGLPLDVGGGYLKGRKINKIFEINYLGTFILTESLIPILKNTKGSRIVNTSSPTHRFFGSDLLKIIECSQTLDYDFAYGASKSALLLYTLRLRRNAMGLTPEKSVGDVEHFPWSTCVNPGSVSTKIFENAFPYNLVWIFKWFLLDFKRGSETTIFASICPREQATLYMTPYWLPGNGSWFIDKYADFLSVYVGPHFGVPYLSEDAALSAEILFEWTRNVVGS
ncbi:oxidoreductase [Cryptosporidium ryanae]|uniref:oxidoreductase n=1 Tax=Cryptosporidium ryanae TaxID=515981 RepID=UPI00351A3A03|nr:oxidoreductase [Cryptosporidium ryanae]